MPLSLCVYNRLSNLGASDDNDEVKANVRERTRYLVWVGGDRTAQWGVAVWQVWRSCSSLLHDVDI